MILYYWIEGAPEDRMGGPWWHREFDDATERQLFLDDLKPFLYAYCESEDHYCELSCGRDTPPGSAIIMRSPAKCPVCGSGWNVEEWGESGEFWWHCHNCNKDFEKDTI